VSSDPPRRRDPSEYRPDLRPMLILAAMLVAIVVGWVLIGPLILPPPAPVAQATGLDGRWTRTPEDPLATTLDLSGTTYSLEGAIAFAGAGRAARDGDDILLTDDSACPDAAGRYAVELGDVDRFGLLPEHRAQTMTLAPVSDSCDARADALGGATWVLRASGRDGVYGICDPPNEEAAITGHWPQPSGCG
jgi:hypothetical protein